MSSLQSLKNHLQPGKVYRRKQLAQWSTTIDRHLKKLVQSGDLTKLSGGLYYHPKQTAFGQSPPTAEDLVSTFLKNDPFLIVSMNAYNALGVGTTQLYNETVVYNHKRYGRITLGGRTFEFRVKRRFPGAASAEFLLVDLVNNLNRLAEDKSFILGKVNEVAEKFDPSQLLEAAKHYGVTRAKKFFTELAKR